jgi:UDP-N-acetylmuramoyl-tripeptide--D-alanyl-D-alanine ligase
MSANATHDVLPMNWLAHELIAALAASPSTIPNSVVARIVTDSRIAGPGDVFVALIGERFDAHGFVAQVAAQGALMAIVSKPVDAPIPQVLVSDTLIALGALAKAWREKFSLPVIAVTGSNGKTTTKEMIACILREQCGADHVLVTQGNLNNEVGVPQTLFNLRAHHQMAVIELGMNHPGEINMLAVITQPTVALVNNAQREHQEFMHSVEAVALENGSVFGHLRGGGVAVFPGSDEFTSRWYELAGAANVITFGFAQATSGSLESDVTVSGQPVPAGQQMQLSGPFGPLSFALPALGQHNLLNAAAAASCAFAAGCSSDAITRGLESFSPVNGRMQPQPFAPLGKTQSCLINDTYNANPDSVKAAIDVLSTYQLTRILVLGDMGEVGNQGPEFHREVGAYAAEKGIDALFALGELSKSSVEAFNALVPENKQCGTHYAAFEQLVEALQATLSDQSIDQDYAILVKGSRFMKMERVIQALSALTPASNNHGGQHAA